MKRSLIAVAACCLLLFCIPPAEAKDTWVIIKKHNVAPISEGPIVTEQEENPITRGVRQPHELWYGFIRTSDLDGKKEGLFVTGGAAKVREEQHTLSIECEKGQRRVEFVIPAAEVDSNATVKYRLDDDPIRTVKGDAAFRMLSLANSATLYDELIGRRRLVIRVTTKESQSEDTFYLTGMEHVVEYMHEMCPRSPKK